ncbi:hypothetical protein TNCV_2876071 [Trichonephila clavipes]|nr:hypothetical protein TNCV_2876071 [Trichonephila clavipes]
MPYGTPGFRGTQFEDLWFIWTVHVELHRLLQQHWANYGLRARCCPCRGSIRLNDHKEVDNDEVEGEVQLLTADLIREGLKFSTNVEPFLTHDPDIEWALKFRRNLRFCVAGYQELYKQLEMSKKKKTVANNNKLVTIKISTEGINNERNFSFESKTTVALGISDTSTGDSIFDPVRNKRYQVAMNSC